jgi:hypothetical protein
MPGGVWQINPVDGVYTVQCDPNATSEESCGAEPTRCVAAERWSEASL